MALLLDAQDLVEVDAGDRGEGRARLGRRHGEALIIPGIGRRCRLRRCAPRQATKWWSRLPLKRGTAASKPGPTSPPPRSIGSAPIGAIPASRASTPSARSLWRRIAPNMPTAPLSKPPPTSPRLLSTSSASQRARPLGRRKHALDPRRRVRRRPLSRYRAGHGAKNMAVVRRFALGLVRAIKTKGSIKTRRKVAGWNAQFPLQGAQSSRRRLC